MDLLPATASPLKLYRQAKRILRTTSRAKEPDWYRPAGQLDLQWHLWIGSYSGYSAIYSRSRQQWWTGPDLPSVSFEASETGKSTGLDQASRNALHELLRQIFAAKEFGSKTRSLGIVIHLADGIRVRELAPEFSADTDFAGINDLLASAPDIALGDDTVNAADGNWRLLPLLGTTTEGGRRSIAVQASSKLRPIVDEFERYGELRNLPVVVETRSAQLEAISGAAYLHPEIHQAGGGPTLALVQYETSTLLFALGELGELLLARPLVHRSSGSLSPTETYEALTQTAALLNIKDPSILMVSLTGVGEGPLHDQLALYTDHFPKARVHCIETTGHPITDGIPGRRFEFATSVQETPPIADEPAFQKELRDRWTRQDFLAPDVAEAAQMPSRSDLRLLKLSGLLQKVAVIGILAFCGWTGMDFVAKMRSEAWLAPGEAETMEMRLAKLAKERSEWEHWNLLLEKRSEGWLALEALLEIFPQDGGVVLGEAQYRAETETSSKDSPQIGLKRQWSLSGYANPEVATDLPALGSRNRVAEILNAIAEGNHAPYLKVGTPTRSLEVTFQQRQGTMQASAEFPTQAARHYRTTFDFRMAQNLTNQDELAIRTAPLPGQ